MRTIVVNIAVRLDGSLSVTVDGLEENQACVVKVAPESVVPDDDPRADWLDIRPETEPATARQRLGLEPI